MKFRIEALAAAFAFCCSLHNTAAFSVQPQSLHIDHQNSGIVSFAGQSAPVSRRLKTQRRLAESDDDEHDDDDEPLAKGVNSVSWLPTVVGAKKVEAEKSDDDEVSAISLMLLAQLQWV
jgi:hypothetical protein